MILNILRRCWWKIVCSGFYLQHLLYEWADKQRNQVPPMTKLQRRIVQVVLILACAAFVYAMWAGGS